MSNNYSYTSYCKLESEVGESPKHSKYMAQGNVIGDSSALSRGLD